MLVDYSRHVRSKIYSELTIKCREIMNYVNSYEKWNIRIGSI